MVCALSEDHPRLFPDRPQRAVVGDLLHHRRDRNQHADLHRHPRAGLHREHDVPAARGRLHHRTGDREHAVHPGILPRRSLYLVRTVAAPLRHPRQDALGGDLPDHALARRRHPPVHDRAGDFNRDAAAGDGGGDGARRRDDRLHDARRRVGGDLDRRRADVRLHCRCRGGGDRAARPDRRRLERGDARRIRNRAAGRDRFGVRLHACLHRVGGPVRRRRVDAVDARHRSIPGSATAIGEIREGGVDRLDPERVHRVRAVHPVPADRRDALYVLPAGTAATGADPAGSNPADLCRERVAEWAGGFHRRGDCRGGAVALTQCDGRHHGERFLSALCQSDRRSGHADARLEAGHGGVGHRAAGGGDRRAVHESLGA